MAVPFSQLVASTYDNVITKRKAANQWAASPFLQWLEANGGVSREPGGATLQPTLDYRINPGADFLATDMTATSLAKTDVITAASYQWATLVVPNNWSLTDEALNSEPNRKINLVSGLVDNAIASHDQTIEKGSFAATGGTDGFNTLVDLFTKTGVGVVGTIDSGVETWWKNKFKQWADATMIADLTALWNQTTKGSTKSPSVLVGSADSHAIYEGKLQPLQRYSSSDTTGRAGFKALEFKTAKFIFSPELTTDSIFMFSTDDTKLYAVTDAWRERRTPIEHQDHAAMNMKVFSVVQWATVNRSRGGVAFKTP